MDVTSEEIRSSRFQGTRHVYDRREVDAFLHRAASTLEMYERKLTVTESHVQSLEKALDLAQSRARAMKTLEARVAELEAALAAAQHNYESARVELEARAEIEQLNRPVVDAEMEAARLRSEAQEEAAAMTATANESADAMLASARAEAEEILQTAFTAQSSLLEEIEQRRVEAEAALTAEIDEMRATAKANLSEEEANALANAQEAEAAALSQAEDVARQLAAAGETEAELRDRLGHAMRDAESALSRARSAEEERDLLIGQLEREVAEAKAERAALENAFAAERQEIVAAAQAVAAGETDELRRQVAQMRTALGNIQRRFATKTLSPAEMEFAAAMVDLDLHDVDQLVDLTSQDPVSGSSSDGTPAHPASGEVTVKSKWAQADAVPPGALREGRGEVEDAPRPPWPTVDKPNWRDTFGSQRKDGATETEESEQEPLGFYERRLAGLRDRLRDVGG